MYMAYRIFHKCAMGAQLLTEFTSERDSLKIFRDNFGNKYGACRIGGNGTYICNRERV